MWKSGNILCYPQFLWISGRLHNRMLTSACCNKNMDILLYCYHFSVLVYLKNRISKNKTIGFLPVLLNTAKCCTSTERKKHLSSCQHASERWHCAFSVTAKHTWLLRIHWIYIPVTCSRKNVDNKNCLYGITCLTGNTGWS